MAYRFKTRSTTSTQKRLTTAACVNLFGEQHATDAAFLESHKSEIVTGDTSIQGEFGVTGTATVGGGGYAHASDIPISNGIGGDTHLTARHIKAGTVADDLIGTFTGSRR